jgi:hypothetical protein
VTKPDLIGAQLRKCIQNLEVTKEHQTGQGLHFPRYHLVYVLVSTQVPASDPLMSTVHSSLPHRNQTTVQQRPNACVTTTRNPSASTVYCVPV